MDKALRNAVVEMAAAWKKSGMKEEGTDDEEEEEEGEGEEGKSEGLKWIHEFVATALPGSRHQVIIYTLCV